jgi:hypothetical protein
VRASRPTEDTRARAPASPAVRLHRDTKAELAEDLAAKDFVMPDSMLLRAESRVVRFHTLREPLRDEIVGWALNPDQLIKLRLQAGEGGTGKTRLLIEVRPFLGVRLALWRCTGFSIAASLGSSLMVIFRSDQGYVFWPMPA